MPTDIIPYDPYHPHLGYTLVVTVLAWVSIAAYSRLALRQDPRLRTVLSGLAIVLPFYAEAGSFLIWMLRPAPDTPVGYILSHIHATVIQRYPIDSFLAPFTIELALALIGCIMTVSLLRFMLGAVRLKQALANAVPIEQTQHRHLVAQLHALIDRPANELPPVMIVDLTYSLAFTTGILRPQIYISSGLFDLLSDDEVLAVFCHEWAHVQRRDTIWNSLVRLLRDVLWFLPGSHLAWRSMLNSQDEACDRQAALMTRQPLVLARALVKVAGATAGVKDLPTAAIPFAMTNTAMQARIEQMIQLTEQVEHPAAEARFGAATLAMVLLVLAVLPALLGS